MQSPSDKHTELVAQICHYLNEAANVPSLDELAKKFAISPFHLQRTFKRIVGISPKQYAQTRRMGRLKEHLKQSGSVTAAIYDAGYNSSSSLYQKLSSQLGMKPSQYKAGGKDLVVNYVVAKCSLGILLVAASDHGVCAVFLDDSQKVVYERLVEEFPKARLTKVENPLLKHSLKTIVDYLSGKKMSIDLPLDIRATAFQRQVWTALLAIPYGATSSYKSIAEAVGKPTASRAVARAIATNPVALLIPCHRVIHSDGTLSGYRWGSQRKAALLRIESGAKK